MMVKKRWLSCLLIIIVSLLPHLARSETIITWYRYDLPPYHILRGEFVGQGPLDYVFELEKQWLSDFRHTTIAVNTTRMNREFLSRKDHRCITASFIFPVSVPGWTWSNAIYVEPPAVVVGNDQAITPLAKNDSVDFEVLLAQENLKFGHFDGRIYGGIVDPLIEEYLDKPNFISVSSYASGESLMRMLNRGRVDFILEFLPEIHWLNLSGQLTTQTKLSNFKIIGHEPLSPVHIGCVNTDWGNKIIARVNKAITPSVRATIWEKYEKWLYTDFAINHFRNAQQQYFGSSAKHITSSKKTGY